MGFNSNTGSVKAVVSAGDLKTAVSIMGTSGGASSTTLGTVPAGKVWRIIAAQITTACGGAGHGLTTLTWDGTTNKILNAWASVNPSYVSADLTLNYSAAIVATAGKTVVLTTAGANNNSTGTVVYVEENA